MSQPIDLGESGIGPAADEFLTFLRDVAFPLVEDRYRADPGLLAPSPSLTALQTHVCRRKRPVLSGIK